MPKVVFFLFIGMLFFSCFRTPEGHVRLHAPFMKGDLTWVDSIVATMTLEEKIGQLILLETDYAMECPEDSIQYWSREGMITGLMPKNLDVAQFFYYKNIATDYSIHPMFFAADGNMSMNTQLSNISQFPTAATISAIKGDSCRLAMEQILLNQYLSTGINLVFGPKLSINQAEDSIYNYNAIENNPEALLLQSAQWMKTLQDQHILSVAGDFKDYYPLPVDSAHILDQQLHPYFNLVQNGLSGILASDTLFTCDTLNLWQTFFLKQYLKDELEFGGLLFTKITTNAEIDEALHSGADIFIINKGVGELSEYLKNYIAQGLMSMKVLDQKVGKVLLAKRWMRAHAEGEEMATKALKNDFLDFAAYDLYQKAVAMPQNYNNIVPFDDIYKRDFRILHFGERELRKFQEYFSKYSLYSSDLIVPDSLGNIPEFYPADINENATVILTLDNIPLQQYKHEAFIADVNALSKKNKVVLINFGSPLNLQFFDKTLSIIQLFESNPINEAIAAQLLFGGLTAEGEMPLALRNFPYHQPSATTPITRLKYARPEEVGIAAHKLVGIDAIVQSAIAKKAMPGCQVLVAKSGKIIYNKSFGYHTYQKKQLVNNNHLYDIASITKIAATTLGAMKLYEQGKIRLNDRVREHLACGKKSPLRNVRLKKLFIHQSGLQANMPISQFVFPKKGRDPYCNEYFCKERKGNYLITVADSFYMDYKWLDELWKDVYRIRPKKAYKFKYSDVNFNLIQRIIETKTGQHLDRYLYKNIYDPLNLRRCMFNPLHKFKKTSIVPTENDTDWRKQLLRGTVHDESAAIMGGIGGNAGLFSNAHDLAIIFQMLLNKGSYGGKQYFKPETVQFFTQSKHGNHRGLGFDKKRSRTKTCSPKASRSTFGHRGFTGTVVWVDPEEELIFIFLSNRIHPNSKNKKMTKKNVRQRVHTVIYDALDTYKNELPEVDLPNGVLVKQET